MSARILRMLAWIVFLAGVLTWLVTGANLGWTKTSVPKKTVDTVTGIEGITWESRFVPGIDFLGASLLVSGLLAGASFLIRRKPHHAD